MNLNDLQENKKSKLASKVLRETFNFDMKLEKFNVAQTNIMLGKVRKLISESRKSMSIHHSQSNPNYLKLMMLEQALSAHLIDLRKYPRVVVENEEVQKSQVILAAQDMIDSIQKMVEQISKMNAEELPAVVRGIENEIGTNESEQFNKSAGEALKTLQSALETSRSGLNSSLGIITGEGSAMPDMTGPDLDSEEAAPVSSSAEELPEIPELPEEPESEPQNMGRERR